MSKFLFALSFAFFVASILGGYLHVSDQSLATSALGCLFTAGAGAIAFIFSDDFPDGI